MKNSQRAGSQDDRAGTAWMRRWWTGEKLSVRLFEVAFVLVLTGALVWAGWFASASQNATWTTVLVHHRRRRRSCLCEAAVLDVTISLTGSAGLRPAWPRRALAIARAGVAVVAVAASGDGSACPSVPADRAISGAAGAGAAGRGQQRRRFRGRDAGGRRGQRLWSGVRADGEVCHGRPGRMSPGLVMAGTGGRAGPAGCWLAWTTTALSRSGTCGGATAARVAGALMRSGG